MVVLSDTLARPGDPGAVEVKHENGLRKGAKLGLLDEVLASEAKVVLLLTQVSQNKITAIQHAKENIRADSIHPGVIETPMTAPNLLADEQARQIAISRHPIGRLGQPEDVAYGAPFLASDE